MGNRQFLSENSNRNFIAALLRGSVGLDRWIDQYIRGPRVHIYQGLYQGFSRVELLSPRRDHVCRTSGAGVSVSLQVSTHPERDTVVRLALSREGRPSYFIQGGVAISNLARVGF